MDNIGWAVRFNRKTKYWELDGNDFYGLRFKKAGMAGTSESQTLCRADVEELHKVLTEYLTGMQQEKDQFDDRG